MGSGGRRWRTFVRRKMLAVQVEDCYYEQSPFLVNPGLPLNPVFGIHFPQYWN